MVGLCLIWQLFTTWYSTRKAPKKVMMKELIIVLSALKPGVDAYRVASGYEQPAYVVNSPETELGENEKEWGRLGCEARQH
jgi:hypothetical protein